jgi:RimJ/RimL family protein N-acetyltransferase
MRTPRIRHGGRWVPGPAARSAPARSYAWRIERTEGTFASDDAHCTAGETTELTSTRLLLRRWRESDREPFARLNADPEVMRHMPSVLTRSESDGLIADIEARFTRDGFGLWALELRDSGELLGFTGLSAVPFAEHFTPAVEVGWRLRRSAWGSGYATEAARTSLAFGFGELALTEIVSFTGAANSRSRAVMERLGMRRDPRDDFEHPLVAPDSPLRAHVLYRLAAEEWRAASPWPR